MIYEQITIIWPLVICLCFLHQAVFGSDEESKMWGRRAAEVSRARLSCAQCWLCWQYLCCCITGSEDRFTLCICRKKAGGGFWTRSCLFPTFSFPFSCSNRLETTHAGCVSWTLKHTPESPQYAKIEFHTERTRGPSELRKSKLQMECKSNLETLFSLHKIVSVWLGSRRRFWKP